MQGNNIIADAVASSPGPSPIFILVLKFLDVNQFSYI